MSTKLTEGIRAQLCAIGQIPGNFAAEFDHWKSLGVQGEYDSYLFGKDGAYSTPKVNGQSNTLRHVHLVPMADAVALAKWNQGWRRRSRKLSDRALVYVSDPYCGNLLIFILDEPSAHAISRMTTPDDRQLMHQFAAVADHFIQTGEIVA